MQNNKPIMLFMAIVMAFSSFACHKTLPATLPKEPTPSALGFIRRTAEVENPSDKVSIRILRDGKIEKEGYNEIVFGAFKAYDLIELASDYRYIKINLFESLGESVVYSPTGGFVFRIPSVNTGYNATTFTKSSNTLRASVASSDDMERRNLAKNPYDYLYANEINAYNTVPSTPSSKLVTDSVAVAGGEVTAFPHAYASRVTENKAIFNPRNAIDGLTQTSTTTHSNYPYLSWGCGQYDDAEFTVYFGREVFVDELVFVLREDVSGTPQHDTYWEEITAEFSDGTTVKCEGLVAGGSKQKYDGGNIKTEFLRLKDFKRKQNANSAMWAALIEVEAWGEDAGANSAAEKTTVSSTFGGKEIQRTPSKYSASDIAQTINSVSKWTLKNKASGLNEWRANVFYTGLMDAFLTTGDEELYLYMRHIADVYGYKVNNGVLTDFGDDYLIGESYLYMNELNPSSYKIDGVIKNADYTLEKVPGNEKGDFGQLYMWWCDALYMSMNIYTLLSRLTGDDKYVNTAYESYLVSRNQLYSDEDNLWFRDLAKLDLKTKAGKPIFWSRGNAWVFAALAKQLLYIEDTDSEMYKTYEADFKVLAESIAALQRDDGTWNVCLNDPAHLGGAEATGTAGFLYGYAVGVQLGILDYGTYFPVLADAYDALTGFCMVSEGKIGYMQTTGWSPDTYQSEQFSMQNTEDFGVGLFLLGASALMRMSSDYAATEVAVPRDSGVLR